MLSPDDRSLVSRDPTIPGLATVLDEVALGGRLRDLLPDGHVDECKVEYVRWKPGTSCVVGLRVVVDGREHRGHAKAHRRGDLDKAAKVLQRADRAASGAAAGVFDDLVTAALLPLDAALPVLAELADPAHRTRVLRRVLSRRRAGVVEAIVPLSYKPERRLVARLDGPDGPVGVLRCLDASGYATARAGATAPWAGPVPRVLGHSDGRRLVAVAWRTADGTLADQWPVAPDLLHALGVALADLHASEPGDLAPRKPAEEAATVAGAGQAVAELLPHLARPATAVARRTARRLAAMPARMAPLHGDLSPDQVLHRRGEITLVDLDAARLGDPAADLGSLGASMGVAAVRHGRSLDEVRGTLATVLHAHGDPDVVARVAPFVVAGLLGRAVEPFRHRWPDWAGATECLVGLAQHWECE